MLYFLNQPKVTIVKFYIFLWTLLFNLQVPHSLCSLLASKMETYFSGVPLVSQPSSALCIGIAALQHKMKDDQCAFYLGTVRRRAAEAMYTYVHYRSVKAYILEAMSDPRLADVIAPVWKNVSLMQCRMYHVPLSTSIKFIFIIS